MIESLKKMPHKPEVDVNDWNKVHPNLLLIADFLVQFCLQHELPFLITRIIAEKIPGVSVSDSHDSKGEFQGKPFHGRAFDSSVKGWPEALRLLYVKETNERFNIGAISFSDHSEKEVVYHDAGLGAHMHNQVRQL